MPLQRAVIRRAVVIVLLVSSFLAVASQVQPSFGLHLLQYAGDFFCIDGWPIACDGTAPNFAGNEGDDAAAIELFKMSNVPSTQMVEVHVYTNGLDGFYVGVYNNDTGDLLGSRFGPFFTTSAGDVALEISNGPTVSGTIWLGFTRSHGSEPSQSNAGGFCKYAYTLNHWNDNWPTNISDLNCQSADWGDSIWFANVTTTQGVTPTIQATTTSSCVGGSGPVLALPSALPGTAVKAFGDDFESGDLSTQWSDTGPVGMPAQFSSFAYDGCYSLKLGDDIDESASLGRDSILHPGYSNVSIPVSATELWVQGYVYGENPVSSGSLIFVGNPYDDYLWGGQVGISGGYYQFTFVYGNLPNPNASVLTVSIAPANATWTLLEFQIVLAQQGSLSFYINGTLAASQTGMDTRMLEPSLSSVSFNDASTIDINGWYSTYYDDFGIYYVESTTTTTASTTTASTTVAPPVNVWGNNNPSTSTTSSATSTTQTAESNSLTTSSTSRASGFGLLNQYFVAPVFGGLSWSFRFLGSWSAWWLWAILIVIVALAAVGRKTRKRGRRK